MKMPKGKYMSVVKVGEKGQIVIPKQARDLFEIKPGDNILLLADVNKGIALTNASFADVLFGGIPDLKPKEEK